MGVIKRQGIKHSIVTFGGILIGMINVLFIYTFALTKTELGLIRFLIDTSMLLVPFVTLGITSASIRYFPKFRNKAKGHNGFLFYLLGIVCLGIILFWIFSWIFKAPILNYYGQQEDAILFLQFLPYLLLLVPAMAFADLLFHYISNFQRITVSAIINDLFVKIALPSIVLAYFWQLLDLSQLVNSLVAIYIFVALVLVIYLWKLGQFFIRPQFDFYKKDLVKDISQFAAFGLLGNIGAILATRIDTFMVSSMIDLGATGVYTIALFVATVVGVPMKSAYTIYGPVVAKAWSEQNLSKIANDYKSTSLNLVIIGVLILIGIWASVDYFFEIIPNGTTYIEGKYVILLLGLAKLVDMSTSLNTHIIAYSKFYKFNLYISLVLAVLNIGLNILLIPIFGLIGVAMATLFSGIVFNIGKVIFVQWKFKMQPFSKNMLGVLGIAGIAYGITLTLPETGNAFINILINSATIILIYLPAIFYFNLSDDLTKIKQEMLIKVKQYLF